MKTVLLAFMILLRCSLSGLLATEEEGVWLRVSNKTGQDLATVELGGKLFFGPVRSKGTSEYLQVKDGFCVSSVMAFAGTKRFEHPSSGTQMSESLPEGYYTCELKLEGDALRVSSVCDTPDLRLKAVPVGNEIAVLGAVRKPGIYPIDPKAKLTLVAALDLAGGPVDGDWVHTLAAVKNKVRVTRAVQGQEETFRSLDVRDPADERKPSQEWGKDRDFLILPGDKIEVPYLF